MAYTKKELVIVEMLLNRVVGVAASVRAQLLEQRNETSLESRQDALDSQAQGATAVLQQLIAFRDWELKP